MTAKDDAILEDATNTTAEQLANEWLTWAKTTLRQPPNNNSQKNCESDPAHPYCLHSVRTYNVHNPVPEFD